MAHDPARSRAHADAWANGCASLALLAALTASPVRAAEALAPSSVLNYPAAFFVPMTPNTAYDMVLRTPGFTFDDGSVVRGFAGAAGNVLVNGQRPTNKTDDLYAVLNRIPAGQVERIELIRGGAPGIDMQGKTLVANVILKRGGGFTGVVALGQYSTGDGYTDPQLKLEGTWRDGARTVQLSLTGAKGHDNSQGSGQHTLYGPNGQVLDSSPQDNTGPVRQFEGAGSIETPLMGGTFRVNLTLVTNPYEAANLDDFRIAGAEVNRFKQVKDDGELGLHYSRDLGASLTLEAIGLQHLSTNRSLSSFVTSTDDQRFDLSAPGGESIGRGILHWRPTSTLTIDGGGEFAYTWLSTRTRFSDNGVAIALPAADVDINEGRGEAFTTLTWRANPTLTIEAGMRVEASQLASTGDVVLSNRFVFPKPRVVLTWSPDAADQLRLRVEREIGQLDFTNFVAVAALNTSGVAAGNPNLAPQQDWAIEAAYERRFWRDGVASFTFRHLFLTDVVDRVPVLASTGLFDEPGNIGSASETDLVGALSLPLGPFGIPGGSFRGQGTWRFSELTDPATGEKRRISGQHPLDADVHFAQDLPRWRLTWGIDAIIGYQERFFRFDEIDTNRTNTVATFYSEYKPWPDIALRVSLDLPRNRYLITREVFAGLRGSAPVQLFDLQDHRFGPVLFTRIRKTF